MDRGGNIVRILAGRKAPRLRKQRRSRLQGRERVDKSAELASKRRGDSSRPRLWKVRGGLEDFRPGGSDRGAGRKKDPKIAGRLRRAQRL